MISLKRKSAGGIFLGTDQPIRDQLADLKKIDEKSERDRAKLALMIHEVFDGWVPDGKKIIDGDGRTVSVQKKKPLRDMQWVRQETLDKQVEETGWGPAMHFRKEEETEKDALDFMAQSGCKQIRSYAVFCSISYFGGENTWDEEDAKKRFFPFLADPLIKELKQSDDPDKVLQNFSDNIGDLPNNIKGIFFAQLGRNPNALRQYLGINHIDQEALIEFYKQFAKNPKAFEGQIKK